MDSPQFIAPRLLLSLFIACTVSALTPISAVHELLQHAIELPDGRMLVLTPQRLVLLNSAADKTVGASHWCPSSGFYRAAFTVHDGHAFLPTERSIQVIRIGKEELEQVGAIDISYAWAVRPIIENGHLYSMRGQRELRIFDLADLSAPQQVAALDFKTSGHSFAIVKGHIYIADKNQLQIFDISTPALPRRIELDLRLAGDLFGAMHVDGDKLYSFTDKGLNILNITDPAVPTLSEFHKKVSMADRVLKQGNEWLAFYGSGGLKLVPSRKDGLASERLAYSWRVETTSDPVKVVADFAAAGLFTNRQLAGGAVLDDLLVLFDGAKTHVFDVADPANPRRLSTLDFSGGSGEVVVHGKRLYFRSGYLDLSDPMNPVSARLRGGSRCVLDGDILYLVQGRRVGRWDVSGDVPEELESIQVDKASEMFTVYREHIIRIDRAGELQISEIADDKLTHVSTIKIEGERERPYSMNVHGQVLYVVYSGAVRAFDLAKLDAPRELSVFAGAKRFQYLQARDGVIFGAPSGRHTEAFDLQTGKSLEVGPDIVGARFIKIQGDRLFVGMPGGVVILKSDLLARLQANETARAPLRQQVAQAPENSKVLAQLAELCNTQGAVWEAERHITALDKMELDEESRAIVTAFKTERSRRQKKQAAAAVFESDVRKNRIATLDRDRDGKITGIRVYKQAMFRQHFEHVATLPLTSLSMGREPLVEEDLELLRSLPNLTYLALHSIPEDGLGLSALSTLGKLESLRLEDVKLPAGALAHIAGLKLLEILILEDTGIGDDNLAHIAGLKALQNLDLEGCQVTDAGLVHIRELRKLSRLRLEDCPINGSGFANFANLSKLLFLDLEAVSLESGLEHVGRLTELRELDLQDCILNDEQLAHLAPLINLEELRLDAANVTGAGIAHLSRLHKLKQLDLDGSPVGDDALETIGMLSALEDLSLRATDVTDAGLRHLLALPNLKELDLDDVAGVSDTGMATLAESATLRKLSVRNTQVTAAGVERMPKMRVEWKEREARIPRKQQEEEVRIASIPKELAFRLADNALVLLNAENDAEFARETPADLFGKETVMLKGLAAWEGRCWVGSDHGLLRFEPQTRVWSRFAVDRTHLSVPITGVEIVDTKLLVTYGEGQSARFDLQERRWELAPAAIAPAQNTTSDSPRLSWRFVIMLAVLTLGLGGLLRRGGRKAD